MKKSSFLALAVAPMILGAPLASQAQSVTTDPVGFVKSATNVDSYTLIGVNLNKPAVYGAAIESTTADTITVSDPNASIGDLLDAGSFYVEVTNGAAEGDRIDIASASGNVITLNTAAPHNTLDSAAALPSGSSIVIRPHYTFADLSDAVEGGSLLGGNTAAEADQILTFGDGGFQTHFYGPDGNWYNASNFAEANDNVIAPGSGVLFYANPAGGSREMELLVLGEVRANDLVRPLTAGYQIVSTGFPMDLSPADLVMTTEYFTGGNTAGEADQILTFQGGGFATHFMGPDDNWYRASDFGEVTGEDLFSAQGAVLVYRNTDDAGFRVSKQY